MSARDPHERSQRWRSFISITALARAPAVRVQDCCCSPPEASGLPTCLLTCLPALLAHRWPSSSSSPPPRARCLALEPARAFHAAPVNGHG